MGMNIKNATVERLARELANESDLVLGRTVTQRARDETGPLSEE